MGEDAKQQLRSVEFDDILKKTLNFITKCNEIVVNSDNDAFTIEIESDFRPKRVRLTKRMPGEQAKDSRPPDPITRFRVEVYRSVIDQITSSLEKRFTVNRAIILDTSCLDPQRFNDGVIPLGSFDKVA